MKAVANWYAKQNTEKRILFFVSFDNANNEHLSTIITFLRTLTYFDVSS